MTEPPRRLPRTPEERLRTVVSRVAGGSDAGSTRFARPVAPSPSRQSPDTGGLVHTGDTAGRVNAVAIVSTDGDDTATTADGDGSVAVGSYALAHGDGGVAVGCFASTASGAGAVAVGAQSEAGSDHSVAVGFLAQSEVVGGVAVGWDSLVTGDYDYGVAVGRSAQSTGAAGVAVGLNAHAYGDHSMAAGEVSEATGYGSLAVGWAAVAAADQSVAIGENCVAGQPGGIVVGFYARAYGSNSLALGSGANAGTSGSPADGAVAVGTDSAGVGATATDANDFILGTGLHNVHVPGKLLIPDVGGGYVQIVSTGGVLSTVPYP